MKNKWHWKKEVTGNRRKMWGDGTVEYGTLTTWHLQQADRETASLFKEWYCKDWTCESNQSFHYRGVLSGMSLAEAKRYAESLFEDQMLSDTVEQVKPVLSQSTIKRM